MMTTGEYIPADQKSEQQPPAEFDPIIKLLTINYALFALGFVTGWLSWLAAIVICYLKIDTVRGSWLESHFRWQMRIFWVGLLWSIIGVITVFIFIGILILTVVTVWVIYCIIKGWLALYERQPVRRYSNKTVQG